MLNNTACALEKSVCCAAVEWNVLNMCVKIIWFKALFSSNVSLLIFCLDKKFPTWRLLIFALYIKVLWYWVHIYYFYFLLMESTHQCFLSYYSFFLLKFYLFWCKCCYFYSLLVSICMEYIFLSLNFSPCVSLKLNWFSYRQHMVGSFFFLNHPSILSSDWRIKSIYL